MIVEAEYFGIARDLLKQKKAKGETQISSGELKVYTPTEVTKIFGAIEILCDTEPSILRIKKHLIDKETKETIIEFVPEK